MKDSDDYITAFPSAEEDADAAEKAADTEQTRASAYRLAYNDIDFMLRDELRPVRLQLELLKPELLQQENNIHSTVVIFGSARIPEASVSEKKLKRAETRAREKPRDPGRKKKLGIARSIHRKSHYYEQARELARLITEHSQTDEECNLVVITGGGPGIMEAANRGAMEANGKSIGLNIVLPFEQRPNEYITPDLCFQFHYFAIRKMHFLMRARALVACPGGFGTLDELFETLTLIQTKKIKPVPVLLLGEDYWRKVINFEVLVEEGTIDEKDLALFNYVETADEAWKIIRQCSS